MTDQASAKPVELPTRERLVGAAIQVFGTHGFQAATVAEICREAGANIAAINYHFGDKSGLYRQAWEVAFKAALAAFPYDEGLSEDAEPEVRLRTHIRSLIYRMGAIGPAGNMQALQMQEQINPTGLVESVLSELLPEPRDYMFQAIREIIGTDVSPEVVERCAHSVMAQCRAVLPLNRREHSMFDGRPLESEFIEELADHIARFSIAGIRATASASNPMQESQ